jgi:hypothetical protein
MLTTPASHSSPVAETPVRGGMLALCWTAFLVKKTPVKNFSPHVIAWQVHQLEVRKNLHHLNILLNNIDATENLEKDKYPKTIQISRCHLVLRRNTRKIL